MKQSADIAVVGSGSAGIAAAVAAARSGCVTALFDRRSSVGGIGGHSGLTTLCGLYDGEGNFLNDGFSKEFAEFVAEASPVRLGRLFVLPYHPAKFIDVANQLFAELPNLRLHWSNPIESVIMQNNRITHVNGIGVQAVIDCTGSAEIARAAGLECLSTDEKTQSSAVVFPLRHVPENLDSMEAVTRVLLPLTRAGLPPLSFQPSPEPDTITVKFAGRASQVTEVVNVLRTQVTGFEACETPAVEFNETPRAGRMIRGNYLLTGDDVLAGRSFPDAVARCAWPIEQWNENGKPSLKYLPQGKHYEIPARSLQAAQLENLFMAGKTISADVDAIASARVMGCCLATGAAAGELAATLVKSLRA